MEEGREERALAEIERQESRKERALAAIEREETKKHRIHAEAQRDLLVKNLIEEKCPECPEFYMGDVGRMLSDLVYSGNATSHTPGEWFFNQPASGVVGITSGVIFLLNYCSGRLVSRFASWSGSTEKIWEKVGSFFYCKIFLD
jgi:hypothetical protein